MWIYVKIDDDIIKFRWFSNNIFDWWKDEDEKKRGKIFLPDMDNVWWYSDVYELSTTFE